MTATIANLLLNLIMAGLLTATIIYCSVLNRRIKVLQDSKSDLANLLSQFDESTEKAAETIVAMQTSSKKIGENIQLRIDKANYLLDDLSFAIEKGSKLANQIEASFAINRAKNRIQTEETAPLNEHEHHEKTHDHPQAAKQQQQGKRSAASIEAILEKVVNRPKTGHAYEADQKPEAKQERSRAEQELIELIRSAGMKG